MKRLPYKHILTAYNGINNWYYTNRSFYHLDSQQKQNFLKKGMMLFLESINLPVTYKQQYKKNQQKWALVDVEKNATKIQTHFYEFCQFLVDLNKTNPLN